MHHVKREVIIENKPFIMSADGSDVDPEVLAVRWRNHDENIKVQLEKLHISKQHADIIVMSEDGLKMECHKIVLAAASRYFKQLFDDSAKGFCEGCVPDICFILHGVSGALLQVLIKYIYLGHVFIGSELYDDFHRTAIRLKFEGMAEPRLDLDCALNFLSSTAAIKAAAAVTDPAAAAVAIAAYQRVQYANSGPPTPPTAHHGLNVLAYAAGRHRPSSESSTATSYYAENDENSSDNLPKAMNLSTKDQDFFLPLPGPANRVSISQTPSPIDMSTSASNAAFNVRNASPEVHGQVSSMPMTIIPTNMLMHNTGVSMLALSPTGIQKPALAPAPAAAIAHTAKPSKKRRRKNGDENKGSRGNEKSWKSRQPQECEECGRVFSNKFNLKQHKMNMHTTGEDVPCPLCEKTVKNKWYLRRHQVTHHNFELKKKARDKKAKKERKEKQCHIKK